MSTTSGGVTTLDEIFVERGDGQYVQAVLQDGAATAIDTSAITAIVATLRSRGLGSIVNGMDEVSVLPGGGSRGSYPGAAGTYRLTFTSADLQTVGTQEYQSRALTLIVTHSGGKQWSHEFRFRLHNLSDVD